VRERLPVEGLEPLPTGVGLDPGELPFGELARCRHRPLHRLIERATALEVGHELTVTDRAQGRRTARQIGPAAQRFDLGEKTRGHHPLESLSDPYMQQPAIRRHERIARKCEPGGGRLRRTLPIADRATTDGVHLERALDALRIVGMDALRRLGVDGLRARRAAPAIRASRHERR